MGLKTITPVSGEVNTTNDTWTTVASCVVGADCSFLIKDIFASGRATNGTVGETAVATAIHRGKRVSGVLTLKGFILFILTFTTGSDSSLVDCDMQIVISGTSVLLQVKGIAARNISWYGGFTVIKN